VNKAEEEELGGYMSASAGHLLGEKGAVSESATSPFMFWVDVIGRELEFRILQCLQATCI